VCVCVARSVALWRVVHRYNEVQKLLLSFLKEGSINNLSGGPSLIVGVLRQENERAIKNRGILQAVLLYSVDLDTDSVV
jgi:hypothetical protein